MKKHVSFESKEHLTLASSYGVIKKEEVEIEVNISIDGNRGSFELYDLETGGESWYAEGGLWLEKETHLIEYDGVHDLPTVVSNKLIEMGINLDNL